MPAPFLGSRHAWLRAHPWRSSPPRHDDRIITPQTEDCPVLSAARRRQTQDSRRRRDGCGERRRRGQVYTFHFSTKRSAMLR
jgi:hypothetical protein